MNDMKVNTFSPSWYILRDSHTHSKIPLDGEVEADSLSLAGVAVPIILHGNNFIEAYKCISDRKVS
jgi:hypothetical protein